MNALILLCALSAPTRAERQLEAQRTYGLLLQMQAAQRASDCRKARHRAAMRRPPVVHTYGPAPPRKYVRRTGPWKATAAPARPVEIVNPYVRPAKVPKPTKYRKWSQR